MKKIVIIDTSGNIQGVIEYPENIEFEKNSIVMMDNKTNTVIPTVVADGNNLSDQDVENIKKDLKKFKVSNPEQGMVLRKSNLVSKIT